MSGKYVDDETRKDDVIESPSSTQSITSTCKRTCDEQSVDHRDQHPEVPTHAKKRRIHVTHDKCQEFANSPDLGGKVLSYPAGSTIPNRDINFQYLYPTQLTKKTFSCATGKILSHPENGLNHTASYNAGDSEDKSMKASLVKSFKSGQFGGFTSAAKLHSENPDLSSHFVFKPVLSQKTTQPTSNKSHMHLDSRQKSITTFFGESSSNMHGHRTSSNATSRPTMGRTTPIIISDSPISTPEKIDEIDYSSPVKMFSPIKKVDGSRNMYIGDDSPSSSQGSVSNQNSVLFKENSAVKQLFEGQKQYQSNKNRNKGKRSKSSYKSSSKVTPGKGRLQTLKGDSRLSFGHISSDDDDILCTAVDTPSTSKTFGLFGQTENEVFDEQGKIDYFELLPDELLEIIFAQLPMLDLCLNSNRVCTRWSQIISSERVSIEIR